MRERPILFSGPMVRAILAGRKTMTRRVVTPAKGRQSEWCSVALLSRSPAAAIVPDHGDAGAQFDHPLGGPLGWVACPFGAPGDRLWVRETWRPWFDDDEYAVVQFRADDSIRKPEGLDVATGWHFSHECDDATDESPWRPSIFMPRWASRITLDVTAVRVERLQEITIEDALEEGACTEAVPYQAGVYPYGSLAYPVATFAAGWDRLNAKRGYGWDANPWVWVVSFRRTPPHQPPVEEGSR